jgi:hypothetical protein
MDDAGLQLVNGGGFVAPMDSYDKATEELLLERGIGHYLSFMDATDARLPFFAKGSTDVNKATVVLPRTQPGPEEATEEGDPDEGMQSFLEEFALSESMGGLSVIRIPTQTILAEPHRGVFDLKSQRGKCGWMRRGGAVVASVRLGHAKARPGGVGASSGGEGQGGSMDQPSNAASRRLASADLDDYRRLKWDAWRSAVVLDGLVPGVLLVPVL